MADKALVVVADTIQHVVGDSYDTTEAENCNVLTRCSLQISQVNQIVRSQPQGEHPPDTLCAAMPYLAHQRDGLQPSEKSAPPIFVFSDSLHTQHAVSCVHQWHWSDSCRSAQRVALPSNAAEC